MIASTSDILTASSKPNIVVFFVDDMGYGDASCLNPAGKIRTEHLDRFASQGMIFTDAHSSSALCSPSRYGLLTGRYNWRSTLQSAIVFQYDKPLIGADRVTFPGLLNRHGYHTACIGKWHLGWDWPFTADRADFYPDDAALTADGEYEATDAQRARWREAFSQRIPGGPTTRGFDSYFGVDVPNWPPYCYIDNDRTVGIPSEFLPARLSHNLLGSGSGPAMPYWHFEQLLPMWARKADHYIKERAAARQPFFLYLPMTSPHTPLSPNAPWIGKSGLNSPYADLMLETDDVFGRVLASLDKHGVADNTLVVFASDNGFARYVGADNLEAQGHRPSAGFRGYKADAWDGGHRIPCIARWPGVIDPGSTCDQLVCLTDWMATAAAAIDAPLPADAGEDSVSLLPLLQDPTVAVRDHVINHSGGGKFAIRDREWKLILCPGSGGWWSLRDDDAARQGLPLVQLYNLRDDPGEQHNIHANHPDRVKAMIARLKQLVADGRSTPGPGQSNDAPVDIWKLDTMPGVDAATLGE